MTIKVKILKENIDTKVINGIRYNVNAKGDLYTKNKNGQWHSFNDMPAIIRSNGSKYWYKDGYLHRDNDKPAVIRADGTKAWFIDGDIHRYSDEPAIIYPNGAKKWYSHGEQIPEPGK